MGKIAKGVNKINFTMLYGNYCYIFIKNFPQKFSPCSVNINCTQKTITVGTSRIIKCDLVILCKIWKLSGRKIDFLEWSWLLEEFTVRCARECVQIIVRRLQDRRSECVHAHGQSIYLQCVQSTYTICTIYYNPSRTPRAIHYASRYISNSLARRKQAERSRPLRSSVSKPIHHHYHWRA